VVNGENPYLLRQFNGKVDRYELGSISACIENGYRGAIKAVFSNAKFNEGNLREAGLSRDHLLEEVGKGKNVYSMFFEHLEDLADGHPIQNTPTILFGNQEIKVAYYLQALYPLFMKAGRDDTEGWICIGVAFRYNAGQDIRVFSPFFQ
jgi:hypothetical protein